MSVLAAFLSALSAMGLGVVLAGLYHAVRLKLSGSRPVQFYEGWRL